MKNKEAKDNREREALQKKKKELIELIKLIDNSNTIMVTYTTNVPSSQLQKIRKKLKNAQIKIIKKNMCIRALEGSKKEKIKELEHHIKESYALIFSNADPFDLASLLAEYRFSMKAKAGQIAENDIRIEEGATELMPGPVITEFGTAGIKTGIIGGKVAIKEAKVVAKKGEAISKKIADILSKLDILPFKIGLIPVVAYDTKNNTVYTDMIIDKEARLNEMKSGKTNALKLAYSLAYPIKEIIGLLLSKASFHANALSKHMTKHHTQ